MPGHNFDWANCTINVPLSISSLTNGPRGLWTHLDTVLHNRGVCMCMLENHRFDVSWWGRWGVHNLGSVTSLCRSRVGRLMKCWIWLNSAWTSAQGDILCTVNAGHWNEVPCRMSLTSLTSFEAVSCHPRLCREVLWSWAPSVSDTLTQYMLESGCL